MHRDTAGKQKYESLSELFYRGVMGVVYVFDLTNKNTFKNIDKWVHKLTSSPHCKQNLFYYRNKYLRPKNEISMLQKIFLGQFFTLWSFLKLIETIFNNFSKNFHIIKRLRATNITSRSACDPWAAVWPSENIIWRSACDPRAAVWPSLL